MFTQPIKVGDRLNSSNPNLIYRGRNASTTLLEATLGFNNTNYPFTIYLQGSLDQIRTNMEEYFGKRSAYLQENEAQFANIGEIVRLPDIFLSSTEMVYAGEGDSGASIVLYETNWTRERITQYTFTAPQPEVPTIVLFEKGTLTFKSVDLHGCYFSYAPKSRLHRARERLL